ncbi:MAG: hypothetical protein AAFX90_18165 [Pseudomonadota bacterium]
MTDEFCPVTIEDLQQIDRILDMAERKKKLEDLNRLREEGRQLLKKIKEVADKSQH